MKIKVDLTSQFLGSCFSEYFPRYVEIVGAISLKSRLEGPGFAIAHLLLYPPFAITSFSQSFIGGRYAEIIDGDISCGLSGV